MSRARRVIFTVVCIIVAFFGVSFPLLAQEGDPASGNESSAPGAETLPRAEAGPDESAIILGESPAVPEAAGASSIFVVLRMVLVLALAALAIYAAVFFIKRLAGPRESRDPNLKVLARVPLSGDSFAAVISVGAKAWLVGGGSGGLNLISEIDDPESLETMLLEDARRTSAGRLADFRSIFRRLGRAAPQANEDNPGSSHAENLRKQRERLGGE